MSNRMGDLKQHVTTKPVSAKKDLLDQYNFLALLGLVPRQHTAKSGMRYGNYVQLCDIATNRIMRVLKMLQNTASDREVELDSMIKTINSAGVRLHLEK